MVDPDGKDVAWRRDRYGSLYADKGDNYNTLKAFLARESFSARGEPVDHRNVEFRTDALWSRLQIRGFVTNGSVREGFVLGPQGQLDAIRDHVHGTGMIDASIDVIGARLIGGLIGGATGWLGKQWVTMFGREVTEVVAAKGGAEIIASNGIKITGFTGHGVNRAIGSVGRQGVSPSSILDALKNPLKINNIVTDQLGRQSQRFIGQFGEVVVNPQTGRIISVNPTSSSKAAKLLQQLGQ